MQYAKVYRSYACEYRWGKWMFDLRLGIDRARAASGCWFGMTNS